MLNFSKHIINREKFKTRMAGYNFSQLCYFVSFIIIVVSLIGGLSTFYLALCIAILGLARELNVLFLKLWDYALGKSFIVIIYAGAANIALAYAASQINQITGIEPYPFIFTIGFTALVFTPFWVALSSLLILSVVLISINLWLVLSILLRIFRVNVRAHWEDHQNVWLTMIMRLLLVPFVCAYLFSIVFPYFADSSFEALFTNKIYQRVIALDANENIEETTISAEENANASLFDQETRRKGRFLKSIIADFIFYFEAYEYSSCKKESGQRSVVIDDFSVLLISIDETKPYGYRYIVAKCEPVYE